jgi:hypothetical protein
MKREVFKKELETFQAVLDKHKEGESVTAIKYRLDDLEAEFAIVLFV